ncbi:MAG: division/cell wall cluster transcriptional repressor MraZ [Deltaproteobacteria bacterium]|nr:division/cell wall cluster transcriptional repressor MraZ [Deltaproteobacteria bacterium]MBW2445704.1 division/cell wall cluster transcriptional repressor MraZ [Deltaproteobacteria bacterium]
MFQGRFIHTIDNKGRLSIPADFRMALQGKSKSKSKAPTLTVQPDCLALYPAEDWGRIKQNLEDAPAIDPNAQSLKRFLMSNAHTCPIDGPGRISVPPHLREYAGLEREVTVAGVGSHIELWNKARYDEEISKVRSNFNELSSLVARGQS